MLDILQRHLNGSFRLIKLKIFSRTVEVFLADSLEGRAVLLTGWILRGVLPRPLPLPNHSYAIHWPLRGPGLQGKPLTCVMSFVKDWPFSPILQFLIRTSYLFCLCFSQWPQVIFVPHLVVLSMRFTRHLSVSQQARQYGPLSSPSSFFT